MIPSTPGSSRKAFRISVVVFSNPWASQSGKMSTGFRVLEAVAITRPILARVDSSSRATCKPSSTDASMLRIAWAPL